jgi:hypothetical protein
MTARLWSQVSKRRIFSEKIFLHPNTKTNTKEQVTYIKRPGQLLIKSESPDRKTERKIKSPNEKQLCNKKKE